MGGPSTSHQVLTIALLAIFVIAPIATAFLSGPARALMAEVLGRSTSGTVGPVATTV